MKCHVINMFLHRHAYKQKCTWKLIWYKKGIRHFRFTLVKLTAVSKKGNKHVVTNRPWMHFIRFANTIIVKVRWKYMHAHSLPSVNHTAYSGSTAASWKVFYVEFIRNRLKFHRLFTWIGYRDITPIWRVVEQFLMWIVNSFLSGFVSSEALPWYSV